MDTAVHLTASSDYVYRGISRSAEDPTLQGGLDLEAGRWFGGAWFSTLGEEHAGERDFEAVPYVGANLRLSETWRVDALLAHHLFPGADAGFDDAFTEVSLITSYRHWLTTELTWIPEAPGSESAIVYLEAEASRALSAHWDASANVGFGESSRALGTDYFFGDLGLTGHWGAWSLDARVHWTDDRSSDRFGDNAGSRFVLSLSFAR